MKAFTFLSILCSICLMGPALYATTVNTDCAGNYTTWTDGSNEGGGFEAWSVTSDSGDDGYAGFGIWGSTNIDLNMGDAFGFTARGDGAYINISRDFSTELADGDMFALDLGLNYPAGPNGSKGFALYTSDGREVVVVNQGSTSNITVNGTTVLSTYGTATMYWTFTQNSATELTVYTTGRGGESENNTEIIAFSEDSYIAGIRFYASSITNDAYSDYRAVFFDNLTLTQGASSDSVFSYSSEDGHVVITDIDDAVSGALIIPATLGGYPVTGISRTAGAGCTNITSLSFVDGDALTNLGVNAFQGCTALQSAALPSGLSALPIGLFQSCTSLASVTIPTGVESIESSAFAGCRTLTAAELPDGLTALGESAFLNCRSLTALDIPDGITDIPGQLCYECRNLSSLTLPAAVTNIGYRAFYNCKALTDISIPESVTNIEDGAFKGCSSLTTLVFDGALDCIGDEAFYGCSALESIYFNSGVTTLSDAVFGQTARLATLYFVCDVPELDTGEDLFIGSDSVTIYYMADPSNWESTFAGASVRGWGPTISTLSITNGTFEVGFEWSTDGTAYLQACTNLTEGTWFNVSSGTISSGACTLSDPEAYTDESCFYRIMIP